ncbi:MAG: PQQ-dependent sugar dehydrogenase [Gemmatimonadota bacterium]
MVLSKSGYEKNASGWTLTALAAPGILMVALTLYGCGESSTGGGVPASGGEPGIRAADVPDDALSVMAEGLDTPWELRFLPGGDLLVTERPGRLLRLSRDPARGSDQGPPFTVVERHRVEGVREVSESGLMGLALHPDYPEPPLIYLCFTAEAEDGLENRVVRYRYADGELSERVALLEGIAGAPVHDGCRLAFGPDGYLYVTTGDAGNESLARDPSSLNGKILRLGDAGEIPPDNPSDTPVWSLGHRNPQGLAFDGQGRLWATEHGPSGFRSGRDELNRIERGGDYGWPELTGDETAAGARAPILHSGSDTWAPAGLTVSGTSLFFGGLRGSALYEVRGVLTGEANPRLIAHFRGDFGRIRLVRRGPDGQVWFGTSNRDGRGSPAEADDRILRLDLSAPGLPSPSGG